MERRYVCRMPSVRDMRFLGGTRIRHVRYWQGPPGIASGRRGIWGFMPDGRRKLWKVGQRTEEVWKKEAERIVRKEQEGERIAEKEAEWKKVTEMKPEGKTSGKLREET